MTSRQTKKKIVEHLRSMFASRDAKIVGPSAVIFRLAEPGFHCGYSIDVLTKYGDKLIGAFLCIYWDEFSALENRMDAAEPWTNAPIGNEEQSAIVVDFSDLREGWPRGGRSVASDRDVGNAIEELSSIATKEGIDFCNEHGSVEGLFKLLQNRGPRYPGSWRISLEYLLREHLHGVEIACNQLKYVVPISDYEKHQQSWILRNKCDLKL